MMLLLSLSVGWEKAIALIIISMMLSQYTGGQIDPTYYLTSMQFIIFFCM